MIELIVLEYMDKLPVYVPLPSVPSLAPQPSVPGVGAPLTPPYVVNCGGNHATQEE